MNHSAIPELDKKGLRHFGLTTGGIVAGLFGIVVPWLLSRPWPLWPWIIFGVLAAFALIAPLALNVVYKVWMRFGLLMSRVTTPLILGIVFFLVITPIGIVRHLMKRDSLNRRFDGRATTYRTPSRQAPNNQLERPF
jgi:hypothetical protein